MRGYFERRQWIGCWSGGGNIDAGAKLSAARNGGNHFRRDHQLPHRHQFFRGEYPTRPDP